MLVIEGKISFAQNSRQFAPYRSQSLINFGKFFNEEAELDSGNKDKKLGQKLISARAQFFV